MNWYLDLISLVRQETTGDLAFGNTSSKVLSGISEARWLRTIELLASACMVSRPECSAVLTNLQPQGAVHTVLPLLNSQRYTINLVTPNSNLRRSPSSLARLRITRHRDGQHELSFAARPLQGHATTKRK